MKNFDPCEYRDNASQESYYWTGSCPNGMFAALSIDNDRGTYNRIYYMNGSGAFAVRPVADK